MGDSSSRSSPITFSGILGGGEEAPGSQIGSAAGSLQNDSLLSGVDPGTADADFGFSRPEMRTAPLAGTVQPYDRHVFLCYKTPAVWPPHVEAAEFDRLPRLLSAALVARKPHIAKRTRLTLCEGEDGTDSSNGDVLIFPDMIRYRRLTHFDVDNFVDEVLVKDTEWLPGAAETLSGSYVFVCAHASRDRRCGVCGPVVIKRFQEEIGLRGLKDQVFVSSCSHIGGHKYAGNVIIFSSSINGEVSGHWYGYVSPDDVPIILDQHIGKGNIVDHLWRGQMGLSEEDQKNAQRLRLELNKVAEEKGAQVSIKASENDEVVSDATAAGGCCQGIGNTTCCQNGTLKDKQQTNLADSQEALNTFERKSSYKDGKAEALNTFERKSSYKDGKASSSKRASVRRVCAMPTWFEIWEREDTYAAIAVVVAVASVAVAYSCYRQMK